MLVHFHNVLNAINLWVENVAIKGEAVVCILSVGWDYCAEAKHWDLFVAVVVLQDTSHGLDGFEVLIAAEIIHVVK